MTLPDSDDTDRSKSGASGSVQTDPLIVSFLARCPAEMREKFTPEMLSAIKLAFGARSTGNHAVDFRRSIRTPWGLYYLVLLLGRNRRDNEMRTSVDRALSFAASMVSWLIIWLGIGVIAFMAAYILKTATGFDVFEHGGLHQWLINPIIEQWHRLKG